MTLPWLPKSIRFKEGRFTIESGTAPANLERRYKISKLLISGLSQNENKLQYDAFKFWMKLQKLKFN